MSSVSATVGSPVGLHARPAQIVAKAAATIGFPVSISKGDTTVNAASILALLSLGVSFGDTVTFFTTEPDKDEELARLAELVTRNLDED